MEQQRTTTLASSSLGALSTASFDANDLAALGAFFEHLEAPIDHVMVTAGGPHYATLADVDFDEARRALQKHPMVMVWVARYSPSEVRPVGTLLFMGATAARHPAVGVGISSALTAALPALTASLALEIAPVRVNLDRGRLRRHPCQRRCSAISSDHAATEYAQRCRSGAWSDRPTSPRLPSTSWPTRL